MSIDDAFVKLTGRQATIEERERLHRIREALGLADNDAFWSIVMALEYYDSLWRQYPAQFAEHTARTIERARAAFAAAAQKEAAQAQRVLSAQVAETSVAMARRMADRPLGVHRVTLCLAAVVAFGALCVHAGTRLAPAEGSAHSGHATELHGSSEALGRVLSVPAGWMIFALLLPAAAVGVRVGWDRARDPLAGPGDKILAGCLVALSVAGAAACATLIAQVT